MYFILLTFKYGNFDNNFIGYFYVIIHNCLTAAMLEYSKLLSSNK
jgi:hypothetical protein